MGFVARNQYDAGWVPNADPINGPPNGLLRADNLTLDEFGVVALRPGATTLQTLGGDVHSLFTTFINGTRYRMAGVDSSVYANGAAIQTGLAGSNDVYFGFQLGQILYARSTSKSKYDGATVRNWGIKMQGLKPNVVGAAPDGKTLATGAEKTIIVGNITPWFKVEGASPNGVVQYGPNHYDAGDPLYSAVGAIQLDLAPTKRAVYELLWFSAHDYSVYDGGTLGDDEDSVSMYVWCSDPKQLTTFNLEVDVNDGSFLKDWYNSPNGVATPLANANPHRVLPAPGQTLPPLPPGTVVATDLGTAVLRPAGQKPQPNPRLSHIGLSYPQGGPGSGGSAYPNAGWLHMQFKRSDFVRQGTTSGKDWSTVRALRLVATATTAEFIGRVDTIRMFGGAITGTARWRYVYVNNTGKYQALSAMSPASDPVVLDHQSATVTIPADAARDPQVNEIWVYRFDDQMDTYYRTVPKTGVAGTGSYLVTDSVRTKDALTTNIQIQLDNDVPPDNIIGVAGPHYDRTFVLTNDGVLKPSRKLDPDAFGTGQAIQICGQDEQPLWLFKADNEIFVGTTKDIYRIEGDGAEAPDGTINFAKKDLSMDHVPISHAVAHEGNQIVFLSDDGWRAFDGTGGSTPIAGETSLLYRGYTRHGISPVNLSTGRFRAALNKGKLTAITPEGASTNSSAILYRYEFSPGRWFRAPYPYSFRSIFREKDGTVLLGTSAGGVVQLDANFTSSDDGTPIPTTMWTMADALGMPYQRKKIGMLTWHAYTAGAASSIAVHLDGSDTPATTLTATQAAIDGRSVFDIGNDLLTDNSTPNPHVVPICTRVQFRVTTTAPLGYRFYDVGVQFRERPIPLIARVTQKLAGAGGIKRVSGFEVTCCTLGASRRFTALFDGVRDAQTFDLTTSVEEAETHRLLFTQRARKGTSLQLSIDGEVELDAWSAIITHDEPVGVQVWESGPILDSPREMVWLKALNFKVRAGADLVVTPYFDGVAFQPVTIRVTPDAETVYRIQVPRGYVGRQSMIKVTSCADFFPYWVEPERRDSGSPTQKSRPRQPMKVQPR